MCSRAEALERSVEESASSACKSAAGLLRFKGQHARTAERRLSPDALDSLTVPVVDTVGDAEEVEERRRLRLAG
jgi:hypothetical protein